MLGVPSNTDFCELNPSAVAVLLKSRCCGDQAAVPFSTGDGERLFIARGVLSATRQVTELRQLSVQVALD